MRRLSILVVVLGLLVAGFGRFQPASVASAQGKGFVTLLDGTKLDGWNRVGNANWRIVEGAAQADMGSGFLVSPMSYGDFQMRVEIWVDADANSGVFIRCQDPQKIGAETCYEVNVFDKRPGQEYRTGGIVNVAKVLDKVDAGGRWNTLEITAQGPKLTVVTNGTKTAEAEHKGFARGPFALQYGAGVVKFRKVEIRPL
jgi:hypothetical protein